MDRPQRHAMAAACASCRSGLPAAMRCERSPRARPPTHRGWGGAAFAAPEKAVTHPPKLKMTRKETDTSSMLSASAQNETVTGDCEKICICGRGVAEGRGWAPAGIGANELQKRIEAGGGGTSMPGCAMVPPGACQRQRLLPSRRASRLRRVGGPATVGEQECRCFFAASPPTHAASTAARPAGCLH